MVHFPHFTVEIYKTNTLLIFSYPARYVSVVYISVASLLISQFFLLNPRAHFYVLISRTPETIFKPRRKVSYNCEINTALLLECHYAKDLYIHQQEIQYIYP